MSMSLVWHRGHDNSSIIEYAMSEKWWAFIHKTEGGGLVLRRQTPTFDLIKQQPVEDVTEAKAIAGRWR